MESIAEHFDPGKNGFGFIIETKPDEEYRNIRAEFTVYEVTAMSMDNEVLEKEKYLEAYIKWDGCGHMYFNVDEDNQSYYHACGVEWFALHAALMKRIWYKAFEVMKREVDDEWPEWAK